MFGLVPFGMGKGLAKREDAFDRLFDVFHEPFFTGFDSGAFKVDVKDNGDHYELTADLPGMAKEDVRLSYENGYLTIAAEKKAENDEKDDKGNYIRRERSYGSMSRSFYINDIDEHGADASFKDGVLKVTMPKLAEAKAAGHEIRIN